MTGYKLFFRTQHPDCIQEQSGVGCAGKSKLHDPVLSVAFSTEQASKLQRQDDQGQQLATVKLRPCYMSTFTLSGSQPYIVLPQATGDLLSIRLPIAGPILPATRTTRVPPNRQPKGLQLLQAAHPIAAAPLTQQRLYRQHDAHIVYVAPYGASGAFLSVDFLGGVVVWPPADTPASGLGWIQPSQTFCLARVMKVPQLGEQLVTSDVSEPAG